LVISNESCSVTVAVNHMYLIIHDEHFTAPLPLLHTANDYAVQVISLKIYLCRMEQKK
jgi:hypothetical protein